MLLYGLGLLPTQAVVVSLLAVGIAAVGAVQTWRNKRVDLRVAALFLPALMRFACLDIRQAVGTSLILVAAIGFQAFFLIFRLWIQKS